MNENEKVKSVNYQTATSIKVGRWLREKGFDLASSTGSTLQSLEKDDSLGILRKDPNAIPRKYLFGLITIKELRREFLGTVWFDNPGRNANEQNWVFEVCGEQNLNLTKQLADEMALTFNTRIILCLVQEHPKFETFSSDHEQ